MFRTKTRRCNKDYNEFINSFQQAQEEARATEEKDTLTVDAGDKDDKELPPLSPA